MTQISRTEKFGRWQSLMHMVTRDQKYHNGMIDRHLVAFGGKDKTKCCISLIRKTQKNHRCILGILYINIVLILVIVAVNITLVPVQFYLIQKKHSIFCLSFVSLGLSSQPPPFPPWLGSHLDAMKWNVATMAPSNSVPWVRGQTWLPWCHWPK